MASDVDSLTDSLSNSSLRENLTIKIVEQPLQRFRIRHLSAKQSSQIHGENKDSYPSVEIGGFEQYSTIWIRIVPVTVNYQVHPNVLKCNQCKPSKAKSSESNCSVCKHGIYTRRYDMTTRGNKNLMTFRDLHMYQPSSSNDGLQKELEKKNRNIDPFQKGWKHMENAKGMDIDKVKLCFQIIAKEGSKKVYSEPVCSHTITTTVQAKKKTSPESIIAEDTGDSDGLRIMNHALEPSPSPERGGSKLIVLTSVFDPDQQWYARFYTRSRGLARVKVSTHRNCAMVTETPPLAGAETVFMNIECGTPEKSKRSNAISIAYQGVLDMPATPSTLNTSDNSQTEDESSEVPETVGRFFDADILALNDQFYYASSPQEQPPQLNRIQPEPSESVYKEVASELQMVHTGKPVFVDEQPILHVAKFPAFRHTDGNTYVTDENRKPHLVLPETDTFEEIMSKVRVRVTQTNTGEAMDISLSTDSFSNIACTSGTSMKSLDSLEKYIHLRPHDFGIQVETIGDRFV